MEKAKIKEEVLKECAESGREHPLGWIDLAISKTARAIFEDVEKLVDDDLKTYKNCKKWYHDHTEWIECLQYFKIKLKELPKKWVGE